MNVSISPIKKSEYPLLEDFLYHAIFQASGKLPPDAAPLPREVIFEPEIYLYLENFGTLEGDDGVVAKRNGNIVGAAWTRIIPAYGHIDDETPELAISVLPEYRGQGIGASLLVHLFDLLRGSGYQQTSLSVQKTNPAARLYLKAGYEIILENEEDYIMVKNLQEAQIMPAELSDMEEILALQYAAYQSEAMIHGDFTIQPLRQSLEEALEEFSKDIILKAVQNGEIIGSVRGYADGNTAYLGKLMVHPDHQGKGLGKRLLATIEREFPHQRYELFTSCKSDRNLHLYEIMGYARFREETDEAGIAFAYLEKEKPFLNKFCSLRQRL